MNYFWKRTNFDRIGTNELLTFAKNEKLVGVFQEKKNLIGSF